MSEWSEYQIGAALCRQTFASRCVLLVDNCTWPSYEADVLGVAMCGRLIDVEIKISRSDFRADAAKGKWWHPCPQTWNAEAGRWESSPRVPRPWPPKIWKHYYAMPAEIWTPEMAEQTGSPNSGILLLREKGGSIRVHCERRAKPNRDAYRLKDRDILDIARLANLRMWDAYARAYDAPRKGVAA